MSKKNHIAKNRTDPSDTIRSEVLYLANSTSQKKRAPLEGAAKLGEIIKRMRKAKGMSQSELAGKTPINESYLSSIERGYSYITMNMYFHLCEGLEVSPTEMLTQYCEELARDREDSD